MKLPNQNSETVGRVTFLHNEDFTLESKHIEIRQNRVCKWATFWNILMRQKKFLSQWNVTKNPHTLSKLHSVICHTIHHRVQDTIVKNNRRAGNNVS